MKRPAFQFYPRDWQTDPELRSCSIGARGLWADMLCMAHWGVPYGHLTINGKGMSDSQIVNAVSGATPKYLAELERAGVFSRTDDGTIYSRRMVRDESTRNVRAEGGDLGAEHGTKGGIYGAKGGRPPKSKGGKETPLTDENKPPLKPPPASAVASASALKPTAEEGGGVGEGNSDGSPSAHPPGEKPRGKNGQQALGSRLPAEWRLPDEWRDWALAAYPDLDPQRVVRISLTFRDYWLGKAGKESRKLDWQATWRNWVRRDVGDT